MAVASSQAALSQVPLFRALTENELVILSAQVTRKEYGKHEVIFSQGDDGDGLYIVVSGHVAISRQSVEGDELILAMYEPREYFGELALFDREPRSATAMAAEETTTLFLSRSAFRQFLGTHPQAVFSCLEAIVRQLRRLTDLADEIALLDVRSRLARRLLRLAEQGVVKREESNGRRERGFRITQQQLASMTGATRESVNKHLSSFAEEGIIHIERGYIRIANMNRLEQCSEGLA